VAKQYLPPGIEPSRKAERLGSPALAAQRRLMSAVGRAESEREGQMKTKRPKKISANKLTGQSRVKRLAHAKQSAKK
jgi:hypothetical protein